MLDNYLKIENIILLLKKELTYKNVIGRIIIKKEYNYLHITL
jgi:hypothetical protein